MEKTIWEIPISVLFHYIKYNVIQYKDQDSIKNFQLKKIRALLTHCHQNVPYYRDLFKNIGLNDPDKISWSDFQQIPLLDKETIRRNPDLFIADNAEKFGITKDSTSGSTGSPLHFLLSNSIQANKIAALLRSFNWAGYSFFMPTLNVQSYYFQDRDFKFNPFYRSLRFDSNRLSKQSCISLSEQIKKVKPKIILGFPFDIVSIARFLTEESIKIPLPKAVITYGETLSDRRRELIERFYQAPVYDFYSMHEGSAMISQCNKGSYHLIEDFSYMEIIEQKTEDQINQGNLVGTNYYNYTMPFIRYKIRDNVELSDEKCTCGRSFRVIKKILGKQCDYIQTEDGRFLGAVMSHSIDQAGGVILSQCIQESLTKITVNLIVDKDYNHQSQQNLESGFRKRLGNKMEISFKIVDQLEKIKSGKTPFIISKIGNKYE